MEIQHWYSTKRAISSILSLYKIGKVSNTHLSDVTYIFKLSCFIFSLSMDSPHPQMESMKHEWCVLMMPDWNKVFVRENITFMRAKEVHLVQDKVVSLG